MQCLCEYVSTLWVGLWGYQHTNNALFQKEAVFDQLHTRLVHLELQDRRCVGEARRHRSAGAKALFRSKMLEHRRLQGQMAQLERFKESATAQFDALSNHELNRTFVKAMQGVVGASKGKATREDAESVMDELHDSMSQVKDLSEFLGQPMINGMDEVDDEELELEFLQEEEVVVQPKVQEPKVPEVALPKEMVLSHPMILLSS